jgi:hypothetical protein
LVPSLTPRPSPPEPTWAGFIGRYVSCTNAADQVNQG